MWQLKTGAGNVLGYNFPDLYFIPPDYEIAPSHSCSGLCDVSRSSSGVYAASFKLPPILIRIGKQQ